eukprot:TRINITY_DN394_c0_g1_i1.p1 TRINITY_DN394_c0_g1~~TRINITY_DN394_c0_g1_i1.p1  ORF type:complete len:120 (-),score=31.70 TRINITY_DN394_c0_g1_i1:235-594(-)
MSKVQGAQKEFNTILKFFGIASSGNFMADLGKLSTISMTETAIEENLYKFMFACYDSDGNGSIDATELKALLRDIGEVSNDDELRNIDDPAVAEALKTIDSDGNGSVEFPEFLAWLQAD